MPTFVRTLLKLARFKRLLLDVINALDRHCPLGLDSVMPDHGAAVNILDGVAPVLKSLTPDHE